MHAADAVWQPPVIRTNRAFFAPVPSVALDQAPGSCANITSQAVLHGKDQKQSKAALGELHKKGITREAYVLPNTT